MDKLKSRKLWVTIAGALITVANDGLGLNLPRESIMTVIGLLATFIIGQSIVDFSRNK